MRMKQKRKIDGSNGSTIIIQIETGKYQKDNRKNRKKKIQMDRDLENKKEKDK